MCLLSTVHCQQGGKGRKAMNHRPVTWLYALCIFGPNSILQSLTFPPFVRPFFPLDRISPPCSTYDTTVGHLTTQCLRGAIDATPIAPRCCSPTESSDYPISVIQVKPSADGVEELQVASEGMGGLLICHGGTV